LAAWRTYIPLPYSGQRAIFGGESHVVGGSRVSVPMYIHYYLPMVSDLIPHTVAFLLVPILIGRPNRIGA